MLACCSAFSSSGTVTISLDGTQVAQAIADVNGRVFFKKSGSDLTGLSTAQLEYQQGIEEGLRKKVEGMLKEVLGAEKAIARVSADIDFQQVSIVEEKYDPDSVVLRSEQVTEEKSEGGSSTPAGVPGAKGATARLESGAGLTNKSLFQKENGTRNYEINKINKQTTGPAGTVKRLSVAVMIDGAFKEAKGKDGKAERQYVPRTQNEMTQFESIVKRAIGFSDTRGDQVEVVNVPFAWDAGEKEEPAGIQWQEYLAKAGKPVLNVVLVLIFIFFVARPLLKWLFASRSGGRTMPAAIGAGGREEMSALTGGEQAPAMQLGSDQPDRAADLVRRWLKEK